MITRPDLARALGRELRSARAAKNYTLERVSQVVRGPVRPSTIAAYERGERRVSIERFCMLAEAYDRDPPDLLRAALGNLPSIAQLPLEGFRRAAARPKEPRRGEAAPSS